MKLAVIGSRDFSDYALLCKTLAQVKTPITMLVSGGAIGTDTLADRWAKENGAVIQIHYPDYKNHAPKVAPIIRNRAIVAAADNVLAFWDGRSRGTKAAMDMARQAGKTVHIVLFNQ